MPPRSATTTTWPRSAQRYRSRLERVREILLAWDGVDAPLARWRLLPLGRPTATPGRLTDRLAAEGGALVSPGEFYGRRRAGHVRMAVVQPDERIELVAERLGVLA